MNYQITIDGPAGSGKSTLAKNLAKLLNISYISSGLIYRTIAYFLFSKNIETTQLNDAIFNQLTSDLKQNIDLENDQVFLFKQNITSVLKDEKIAFYTSCISTKAYVRCYVNEIIYELAKKQNIVIDGRDMGTTVFPHAKIKIYLEASLLKRAQRRAKELNVALQTTDFDEIVQKMKQRDEQDYTREISPLKVPENAFIFCTDDYDIEQMTKKIYEFVKSEL